MSAPRPTRRVARAAAAAAVLGAAGLLLAPAAAFADGYGNTAVANNTSVLGVKYGPGGGSGGSSGSGSSTSGTSGSGTQVLGVKYSSGSGSSLAFTGFEAGAVGLVGAGLVAGGAALVVGGRRRSARQLSAL